ncbi:MAG: DNA polymerase III subunit epsilon [Gammaproteobacteria bacterium]|nr:DNA polymerase III subunit epsilon [Gammaproteobacteria bacterium]MDE0611136.1 DNA polymerase III subunit epsilon [Gammaproteobacteria bacterium]
MSDSVSRQVALDLETTGLTVGNRIIEIGCVEIIDRDLTGRQYQSYVNPDCEIEEGAQRVHGITTDQLVGKPRFPEILDEVLEFVKDAEVLIHNAGFDLGFLNHELELAGRADKFEDCCLKVTDTLMLAREKSSGGSSLDQLCDFYQVDRRQREWHGALLDAQLLAHVYLRMTGGQMGLSLEVQTRRRRTNVEKAPIPVLRAGPEERRSHEEFLGVIQAESEEGRACVWQELDRLSKEDG